MKKMLFVCLVIASSVQLVKAQIIIITGNVKGKSNNPLHYVFIADGQAKNAVYTDSQGNFSIAADPGSKLQFAFTGYADTAIEISSNKNLQVVMRPISSGAGQSGSITAQQTIAKESLQANTQNSDMTTLGTGGAISGAGLAHQKGNVHGNRYLFESFVHGFMTDASGELVYNPAYLFDYDKMGGAFLMTQDKATVSEVGYDKIKSFVLYSNDDKRYEFEKVPAIDVSHYIQVLAAGKKYKIYKFIKTRFVKSDYVNSGLTSHGNDYDEFVDDADYYVLDVPGNKLQKLSLKRKSIKADFANEADKVNKYLSDNSDDIDDAYLSILGAYINQ